MSVTNNHVEFVGMKFYIGFLLNICVIYYIMLYKFHFRKSRNSNYICIGCGEDMLINTMKYLQIRFAMCRRQIQEMLEE